MIGNDIVDLSIARSDAWSDLRYLNKVFSISEQAQIGISENPNETLWLLWSMKESSYKAHFRTFEKRELAPRKIECTVLSRQEGEVVIDGFVYSTRSELTKEYIHTIAIEEGSYMTDIQQGLIQEKNPVKVRNNTVSTMKRSFSEMLELNVKSLEFIKTLRNVPYMRYSGKRLYNACSLSHHGRYGAFVISC